jgi:putative transposase
MLPKGMDAMARTARKKSRTGIYHMILRGINRQTLFEDEEDAVKFLQTLDKYQKEGNFKLYAYCLMGNHVHLLIKEENEDLAIAMRGIGARYVYWYNWKYERCGHLFQDRFKSEAVEDDRYFLAVLRYIHLNPVKAGIIEDISMYKWSSYLEYMGKGYLVETDFALKMFSDNREKAIINFREFHQITNDDIKCLDLEEKRVPKDDEAVEIIKNICNVSHCTDVQMMENNRRDRCLKTLKEEGLSTRQLARLTGVSRRVILKA